MIRDWLARCAENIKDYPGYPIGKTIKYLTDPEIISLAGGLPSPDVFQRSLLRRTTEELLSDEAEANRIMQYSPIPGEASLVQAVLRFLERDHISISEKNIVITTGGQHGIDVCGRLFLDPGDVVLVDRPTFAGAIYSFMLQRPRFVGIDIEPDGSSIDGMREAIVELERQGTRPKLIYVVPDFQNPTGITMSLAKREALLDLSYEYDIPIVEDSPYRDLRYAGETIPAIYSLDQQRGGGDIKSGDIKDGNVIGLYTFSKLFCPGIRVGFNIGPEEVVKRMTYVKEGNILNTPKLNQDLCRAFLEDPGFEDHISECRSYYREKLDVFLGTMREHFPEETGVTWTVPEGGLFLWVSMPQEIDTAELFFKAIEHKVAFVPGEQFYGENPARNHIRINFSFVAKEQLAEAVRRLAGCLRSL